MNSFRIGTGNTLIPLPVFFSVSLADVQSDK